MPVSQNVHAVITSYNAIRQNIANSRLLTERVRAFCEADHQQAMVEATNEYNAMLSTLSAVHLRLEEARENLVARQAEIQTQLRYRHAEIVRLEHEIHAMENEATDLLSRAGLSSKERQLIVQNPFPILPAAPVYDVPLLERLYDTIYNALDEFEEHLTKLRQERLWYRRLYRKTQPVLKPGRLAIVIAAIYGAMYFWEGSFFKGEISGIYWLAIFYESTGGFVMFLVLILAAIALRRFGGCLISVFLGIATIFGLLWVVFIMYGYEGTLNHLGSAFGNNHTYYLASRYSTGAGYDRSPYDDYYLFECNDIGIVCNLVGKNEWEDRFKNKPILEVMTSEGPPTSLIVHFKEQVLRIFSDCDKSCLPTDGK